MSKVTLIKGDLVKRTKSAQLIKLLEDNGWKRDLGGVQATKPKGEKAPKES